MMRLYATPTLRHLRLKQRLLARDLVPGESRERVAGFLQRLLERPDGISPAAVPCEWRAALEREFLMVGSAAPVPPVTHHFSAVVAVNFELTYGCNLACNHCLQSGLRPSRGARWLSGAVVSGALKDAEWLGMTSSGVNFTGGEVFARGSPVLEVIAMARGAPSVRCNTNAWWGGRRRFAVGTTVLASDAELIERLRALGLTTLALSVDGRYEKYPGLRERVLRVATLCEDAGLSYEIVATDCPPSELRKTLAELRGRIGREPNWLVERRRGRAKEPGTRDAVDIGAAAGPADVPLDADAVALRSSQSPCRERGFHRPYYLHVNPDGGVRSCLLSPGAAPLGHLAKARLPQILNDADENPVVRLFATGGVAQFAAEHIERFRHLYRNVEHPCAAAALVARVAELVGRRCAEVGRDLTDRELETIHRTIAGEWGIGSGNSAPGANEGLVTLRTNAGSAARDGGR
ncbi:MAG TPA: radical SAM protein [Polyangiaceae bacterium]|nr:radical SAM protein [Polyangiaceae bacterium]